MKPLPTQMTTQSFELLMQEVGIVRHGAPEVFQASVRSDPYAAEVRRLFLAFAGRLEAELFGRRREPRRRLG